MLTREIFSCQHFGDRKRGDGNVPCLKLHVVCIYHSFKLRTYDIYSSITMLDGIFFLLLPTNIPYLNQENVVKIVGGGN